MAASPAGRSTECSLIGPWVVQRGWLAGWLASLLYKVQHACQHLPLVSTLSPVPRLPRARALARAGTRGPCHPNLYFCLGQWEGASVTGQCS